MVEKFNHIRAELSNRPVTLSPAAEYPADVRTIIHEIQRSGVKSLWTIADALNARGVRGTRGGKWYATTVRNLIKRNGANRSAG